MTPLQSIEQRWGRTPLTVQQDAQLLGSHAATQAPFRIHHVRTVLLETVVMLKARADALTGRALSAQGTHVWHTDAPEPSQLAPSARASVPTAIS